MALWFDLNDLPGCATFMEGQAAEELAHSRRIIDHLTERDQKVKLPAIAEAFGMDTKTNGSMWRDGAERPERYLLNWERFTPIWRQTSATDL